MLSQGQKQGSQWKVLINAYMHAKFKKSYGRCFSHNGPKPKFAFDLETKNVKSQRQGLQWIVLIKVNISVKFERIIISSSPTMDLNA